MKPYRMTVFGKAGCDKCKVLLKRVEHLVASDPAGDVESAYCDVETEEGLVAFCRSECINPQRIPAVLVSRLDGTSYAPVPASPPEGTGEPHALYGRSRLYQSLGLQTDYAEGGRGVISPRMLRALLKEAREAAAAM